jgi:hypothetical protein
MPTATYNIRPLVIPPGRAVQQGTRRVEFFKRIEFARRPQAAGEDSAFLTLPAGFVLDRVDPILRVAEGEVATMHIGIDGTPSALAVSVNMNGTINARAAIGAPSMGPGQYFHTDTEIRVQTPAATNTLNVAVIDIVISGYLIEPSLEYTYGT